MQLTISPEMKK